MTEEERGPLGIFEKGPIRKALEDKPLLNSDIGNRPLFGFLVKTPKELREFRRSTGSAILSASFLGAYLAILVERAPQPP